MLTYADICSPESLALLHVFLRMLTYADVCSPESLALLHDEEMAARRPSTNFFEIMKSFCAATNDKENKKNVVEDQYKEQNRQILRRRLPAGMLLLCV